MSSEFHVSNRKFFFHSITFIFHYPFYWKIIMHTRACHARTYIQARIFNNNLYNVNYYIFSYKNVFYNNNLYKIFNILIHLF